MRRRWSAATGCGYDRSASPRSASPRRLRRRLQRVVADYRRGRSSPTGWPQARNPVRLHSRVRWGSAAGRCVTGSANFAAEGLVAITSRRGAVVRRLTRHEFRGSHDVREVLESRAIINGLRALLASRPGCGGSKQCGEPADPSRVRRNTPLINDEGPALRSGGSGDSGHGQTQARRRTGLRPGEVADRGR